MLRAKKAPAECDLDMAPMIDMVFLLLIFFMCSATMQNLSVAKEIVLPEVKNPKKREDEKINCVINVLSENTCQINGRNLNLKEFSEELGRFVAENPKGGVILRLDKKASCKVTKDFVKRCAEKGVCDIVISVYEA